MVLEVLLKGLLALAVVLLDEEFSMIVETAQWGLRVLSPVWPVVS